MLGPGNTFIRNKIGKLDYSHHLVGSFWKNVALSLLILGQNSTTASLNVNGFFALFFNQWPQHSLSWSLSCTRQAAPVSKSGWSPPPPGRLVFTGLLMGRPLDELTKESRTGLI